MDDVVVRASRPPRVPRRLRRSVHVRSVDVAATVVFSIVRESVRRSAASSTRRRLGRRGGQRAPVHDLADRPQIDDARSLSPRPRSSPPSSVDRAAFPRRRRRRRRRRSLVRVDGVHEDVRVHDDADPISSRSDRAGVDSSSAFENHQLGRPNERQRRSESRGVVVVVAVAVAVESEVSFFEHVSNRSLASVAERRSRRARPSSRRETLTLRRCKGREVRFRERFRSMLCYCINHVSTRVG